jgi:hypothetical protein
MPELPYTALPTPATPIGDLKSWRLLVRCAKCNRKVVLALVDIAKKQWCELASMEGNRPSSLSPEAGWLVVWQSGYALIYLVAEIILLPVRVPLS